MKVFNSFFFTSTLAAVLLVAVIAMWGGSAAQAQEPLVFTFDNGGVFSGPSNSMFNVTGSLQNTSANADTLDLTTTALTFTGPDFSGGANSHFTDDLFLNSGVSGTIGGVFGIYTALSPGQTISGVSFFTVDTTSVSASTTYNDLASVSGSDSTGVVSFQPNAAAFQVNVQNANPVPEASTVVSFGALLLGGAGLMLCARKRKAADMA